MGNETGRSPVYLLMEFSIGPRLAAPPISEGEVVVHPPPDVPRDMPANPLAKLLPGVMGVATVGMMVIYFTSGTAAMRNPMFMFFPVMMLVSLIGTVAFGGRGGTRIAEINQDRRDYLRYLESVAQSTSKIIEAQRVSLTWRHPAPCSLWMLVGGRRMWERRPEDSDFGHVRVGVGTQRPSTRLVPPELGPVEDLDPVTSTELRRLIRNRSMVPDLPVALAVKGFVAITVRGDIVHHSGSVEGGHMSTRGTAQSRPFADCGCRRSADGSGLGLAEMAATSPTSARE